MRSFSAGSCCHWFIHSFIYSFYIQFLNAYCEPSAEPGGKVKHRGTLPGLGGVSKPEVGLTGRGIYTHGKHAQCSVRGEGWRRGGARMASFWNPEAGGSAHRGNLKRTAPSPPRMTQRVLTNHSTVL